MGFKEQRLPSVSRTTHSVVLSVSAHHWPGFKGFSGLALSFHLVIIRVGYPEVTINSKPPLRALLEHN